jgi:hypothetical protein
MTVPGAGPLGTKPPSPERAKDNQGSQWSPVGGKGPDGPLEPMRFGDSGAVGKGWDIWISFLEGPDGPLEPM